MRCKHCGDYIRSDQNCETCGKHLKTLEQCSCCHDELCHGQIRVQNIHFAGNDHSNVLTPRQREGLKRTS